MKAITLTQPWASLVAMGVKKIETRSWRTNYRGPLAIHAAKGFPDWAKALCIQEPFLTHLEKIEAVHKGSFSINLPLGAVVATCQLTDCVLITNHFVFAENEEHERYFGDYAPGRFAWLLSNIKPLEKPLMYRGALGLWEIWENHL